MAEGNGELHYRLFAKLIMFLTLLLGGGIGFFVGVQVGQDNALTLLQQGRLVEQTTVQATPTAAATTSDVVAKCYEETLGAAHYAEITAGTKELTVDEVFKLLPCTNLE